LEGGKKNQGLHQKNVWVEAQQEKRTTRNRGKTLRKKSIGFEGGRWKFSSKAKKDAEKKKPSYQRLTARASKKKAHYPHETEGKKKVEKRRSLFVATGGRKGTVSAIERKSNHAADYFLKRTSRRGGGAALAHAINSPRRGRDVSYHNCPLGNGNS